MLIARALLALLLFAFIPLGAGAQSVDTPSGGLAPCPWPEMTSRLLDRRVASLAISQTRVVWAVAELSKRANLPLSFIQAEPEESVRLDLQHTTVREVLDSIVAQAPSYRYGTVAGRLILYPRAEKWETVVSNIRLGPGRRVQMARELASELSRRLPAFSKLFGPWILGDPTAYTYMDAVSVTGPASVLELLLQLPGMRPSTYVLVVKREEWLGPSLSVSSRDQLSSIRISASTQTLRRLSESVQLTVTGTVKFDGLQLDLTRGECGTVYASSNPGVLAVSRDGLVKAHSSGEAHITAVNERSSASLSFRVELDEGASAVSPCATPAGQTLAGVTLSLKTVKSRVTLGEPVTVVATLRNDLAESILVDLGQNHKQGFVWLVQEPQGKTAELRLPVLPEPGIVLPGLELLEPGKTYQQELLLNELYQPEKPGRYSLCVGVEPRAWSWCS